MKKFMKVCAIIVAIFFGISILLLTIGGLTGGFQQLRRQILNGGLDITKSFDQWWDSIDSSVNYSLDEDSVFDNLYEVIRDMGNYSQDFSGASVKNLELDLGGCELILKESPDADYHMEAKSIAALQAYVSDETLHINGLQNGIVSSISMKITLSIPADAALGYVSMSLGAGDFQISALRAEQISVEIGAGQLQVDSMETAQFSCELGAGQAILKNARVTETAAMEVGMGEILFTGEVPGNLTADCSMGNLTITITGSTEQEHNLELECAAGNLEVGDHSYAGLATEQHIDNGAESTYQLSCSMGNLSLRFQ